MDKKHPCADCHACQWCSEERCRMCLKAATCRKKLSMAEQIALYEELNRKCAAGAELVPSRTRP